MLLQWRAVRAAMLSITLHSLLATANTEIINTDVRLCSDSTLADVIAARKIAASWPAIRPSTTPTLFSIVPDAERRAVVDELQAVVPRADEGYWIALRFEDEGGDGGEGSEQPSSPPPSSPSSRYTVRASWPANHPLDLHMTLHTPQSMLTVGGRASASASSPGGDDNEGGGGTENEHATLPSHCSTLYLHIYASSHGVRIPKTPRMSSANRSAVVRWLIAASEAYMAPLSLSSTYKSPLSSLTSPNADFDSHGPTPIHITLEPLVLGVLPRGLMDSLGRLLVVAGIVWLNVRVVASGVFRLDGFAGRLASRVGALLQEE